MTLDEAAPTARVGVRTATLLSLLAGRGTFRLCFGMANVGLLALSGPASFGPYAAALGSMTWLVFAGSAVEKAVLKLAPRTRSLRRALARWAFACAVAPLALALVALAPTALLAPRSRATIYLLAAVWSAATGTLFLVAALHRLAGRPSTDSGTFVTLGLCIVAGLGLTWRLGLAPAAQLALIDAAAVGLVMLTTRRLPAPWRGKPPAGRARVVLRHLVRASTLLGAGDLASAVSVSVLYVALTTAGDGGQADVLYVAMLASGAAGSALLYLLRVATPGTSARLRGAGGHAGRRQARRLLRWSCWSASALAVALCLAAAGGLVGTRAPLGALVAVTAAEVVGYTLVTCAAFLVENTDSRAPVVTAGAAGIGTLTTVGCAVALVPVWGALGAIAALALSTGVQAAALLAALRRWYRSDLLSA